jgi:hypothetical protein
MQTGYMARSSGPDKAIYSKKVTTAVTLVQSVEAIVMILVMTDNVEEDNSSVAEEDADDHESTGTETPFVPGLLDDLIHISSKGKMRKAPQIAELKQKKRGNLLFFSSNLYYN